MEISSNNGKETEEPPLYNHYARKEISALVHRHKLRYGSYIRIRTSLPMFHPTYLLSPMPSFQHSHKLKHRKKNTLNPSELKLPINDDDFILNYGSQLFLQETNSLINLGADLSINAEPIEPYFDDFLFCEVLIRGKYLTKIPDQIALKE